MPSKKRLHSRNIMSMTASETPMHMFIRKARMVHCPTGCDGSYNPHSSWLIAVHLQHQFRAPDGHGEGFFGIARVVIETSDEVAQCALQ